MEIAREWTRAEVWKRKLLYPGHTLPTAIAPGIVAVGLAIHDGVLTILPALGAALAGWLVQLGGVLTDNHQNLVDEPQDREHPELVRALERGTLSLRELRRAIYACYGVAALTGLWLMVQAGIGVLVLGGLSIGASLVYSAGPFPLGRHTLADPLFFLFFGIVSVIGIYYVQAAPTQGAVWSTWILPSALPGTAFLLGVPVGALTTNILIVDDIRDLDFDRKKGKRTLAVRLSRRWSRGEFLGLQILAFLVPLGLWASGRFSAWVLLPWLSLPLAISTARAVLTRDRYEDLLPISPQAGRLLLAYSLLLAVGVAIRGS